MDKWRFPKIGRLPVSQLSSHFNGIFIDIPLFFSHPAIKGYPHDELIPTPQFHVGTRFPLDAKLRHGGEPEPKILVRLVHLLQDLLQGTCREIHSKRIKMPVADRQIRQWKGMNTRFN